MFLGFFGLILGFIVGVFKVFCIGIGDIWGEDFFFFLFYLGDIFLFLLFDEGCLIVVSDFILGYVIFLLIIGIGNLGFVVCMFLGFWYEMVLLLNYFGVIFVVVWVLKFWFFCWGWFVCLIFIGIFGLMFEYVFGCFVLDVWFCIELFGWICEVIL